MSSLKLSSLRLSSFNQPSSSSSTSSCSCSYASHSSYTSPRTGDPITSYPDQDARYALFKYLGTLAEWQGADRETYVTLQTEYKKLNDRITYDAMELKDDYGQTVLHIAVQYCTVDDVSLFLDMGAAPNAIDDKGYTPLFYAAMSNNVGTAETLLRRGADLDLRAKRCGRGPLHIAAMFGSDDVIKLLLDKGCKLDEQESLGLTPIALAAYYRHSKTTEYLLSVGADPFVADKYSITTALRMASTMPTMIRDVFDTLVSEDLYQGERSFDLRKVLRINEDVHSSLFHFLVWKRNMGIVDHPVFQKLTDAKWKLYGAGPAKRAFTFLAVYQLIWLGVYMLGTLPVNTVQDTHYYHTSLYLISLLLVVFKLKGNYMALFRRYRYCVFVDRLITVTNLYEQTVAHAKGQYLIDRNKAKASQDTMNFLNDLKRSPTLMIDFLIDFGLILYLPLKVMSFFYLSLSRIENVCGACVVMALWVNGFYKLQITKRVGPFVIFMKYAQSDLKKVSTCFLALFIPALLVFYKTIYIKGADDQIHRTSHEERLKRAAAKPSKGGGEIDIHQLEGINILTSFFKVLRMVLGDYDYDDGIVRSDQILIRPIWWMTISLVWIVVSSVIVLNLLIALMTDSYQRIFDTAEITARIQRAQFVCDQEKGMSLEMLRRYTTELATCQPLKEFFDPVCDRDRVYVVEERMRSLTGRLAKLEDLVDDKLSSFLMAKLSFVEEALTVYNR